jgi:hypothetical protein
MRCTTSSVETAAAFRKGDAIPPKVAPNDTLDKYLRQFATPQKQKPSTVELLAAHSELLQRWNTPITKGCSQCRLWIIFSAVHFYLRPRCSPGTGYINSSTPAAAKRLHLVLKNPSPPLFTITGSGSCAQTCSIFSANLKNAVLPPAVQPPARHSKCKINPSASIISTLYTFGYTIP